MVHKRIRRTDDEWLTLIQQCRASGLTDKDWCEANGIERSSFYAHIRKLRAKSTLIPCRSGQKALETHECVEVCLEPNDSIPAADNQFHPEFPAGMSASDNPAIRLTIGKISLEIANHAAADTIANTISALRMLC